MTTNTPDKLDAKAARESIAALLSRSGSFRVRKLGERMRHCGSHQLPLFRTEDTHGQSGRPLVLGCRCRVCPECSAAKRGRFDRRYRPQFQALQAAGYPILFVTLTRQTQDWHPGQLKEEIGEVRDCWSSMRYGRKKLQRWNSLIAGGLYGLEATLYRREFGGAIAVDADGCMARRNHAHIHAVVALHPHVDADLACGRIQDWWMDECRDREWEVNEAGQKVERVDAERLDDDSSGNVLNYIVKYLGKPDDLVATDDAEEFLDGCKGVRAVQTFGILHGAALRKCAALRDVAPTEPRPAPEPKAEQLSLWSLWGDYSSEQGHAEWSAELAAEAADQYGDDAAQGERFSARRAEHMAGIVEARACSEQSERLPPLCESGDADRLSYRLRWAAPRRDAAMERAAAARARYRNALAAAADAANAAAAHRTAARQHAATAAELRNNGRDKGADQRERWAAARERRVARSQRYEARRQRGAAAQLKAQAAAQKAAAKLAEDAIKASWAASAMHGRALVLAARAAYDTERSRWHVIRRDDLTPELQRAAYAATDHGEVDGYSGAVYALRGSADRVASAHKAQDSARRRWSELDALRQTKPQLVDHDELHYHETVLSESGQWVEEAEAADLELTRRLPVSVSLVRCAADFGDLTAQRLVSLLDKYEEERAAKAQRGENVSEMRQLRTGVRQQKRRNGAQETLPGLEGSSAA